MSLTQPPLPDNVTNPSHGSGITSPGAGPVLKVQDLTRSYLAALEVRVKLGQAAPGTLTWYTSQFAKLDKAAGVFPAAELRAHHLVAVEFTYHFVRALRSLFKWAADEDVGLVPRDWFKKLTPPPCGERQRVLSRDEMRRLYLACSPRLRRFLFVMSRTIARPGEVRGLVWGDIHWDRRLITLTRFKGKKRRRDGVKVRTIPLDRSALRLLANIYRNRGNPGPAAPVWLDRDGKQWTYNALRCQMRRARCRAGLDVEGVEERVVCYHMRHGAATQATRRGVTDNTLARIMGHSKTATTNRYQHLAGDDLVAAIDRVSARPRPKAG
jgi:integrase